MKTKVLKIVIVLLCLASTDLWSQMVLKEISLKALIDNSTMVVEGEVIAKQSFWDNQLIYTANTVKVYKVFKGEPTSTTIQVITLGGAVGLKALDVSTSLKLQKGHVGIFMLQKSPVNNPVANRILADQFQPFGAIQGFYKYDLYSDVAINPFHKKNGISSKFYKEIMTVTGKNFAEVSAFNTNKFNESINQKTALAPIITNFNPTTATAGTKMQLTINGSGFGSSGVVSFSDADQGGDSSYMNALATQIISWSDTKIVVEIPSGAGTGKIRVTDAALASIVSTEDLTISYSELNVIYDADDETGTGGVNGPEEPYAYSVQHFAQDIASGGYEWEMQTQFFNDSEHPGARAAFERAFETWRCTTLINWTIGSTPTSVDVVKSDGTNVVKFNNGTELPDGVLGTCFSWYSGCGSSAPNLNWFVAELDIVFDSGTTTDWNFGPGATTVLGEFDFETVALHELGHGHQLGHVIDTNAVMHFALSFNEDQRALTTNDITAATDVQNRSTSTSVCGTTAMTDYAGTCNLSVEDELLNAAVKMYPNPSNGIFYITNEPFIQLKKAMIFDLSGRKISEFDLSGSSKTKSMNLIGLSKGIYLINIHSNSAFITKKLILE